MVVTEAPAAPAPPRVASYRTNLVTTLLGAWLTAGVLLDAYAHSNLTELESFFTPWHAVLYSGFMAVAGWILWTARDGLRAPRPDLRRMPVAYGPAVLGVVGFGLSGIGDATWHLVFGIEQDINILFSPTHLGLAVAMLVILTTPLRAALADETLPVAPGTRRLLPALLSTAFAATLVLLFLEYANAFTFGSIDVVSGLSSMDDYFTARLAAAVVLTNLMLIVPLLVLARSWVLPFGAATLVYALCAALSGVLTGLEEPRMVGLLLPVGLVIDLVALLLRPGPDRPVRFLAFAALAPLLTWTAYVAVAYTIAPASLPVPVGERTIWAEPVVELYTGLPIVQALLGLLAALLLRGSSKRGGRAYQ
jgi:hypothetical protein